MTKTLKADENITDPRNLENPKKNKYFKKPHKVYIIEKLLKIKGEEKVLKWAGKRHYILQG